MHLWKIDLKVAYFRIAAVKYTKMHFVLIAGWFERMNIHPMKRQSELKPSEWEKIGCYCYILCIFLCIFHVIQRVYNVVLFCSPSPWTFVKIVNMFRLLLFETIYRFWLLAICCIMIPQKSLLNYSLFSVCLLSFSLCFFHCNLFQLIPLSVQTIHF